MLFFSNTFYFFKYGLYGGWDLWDYFKNTFSTFVSLISTGAVKDRQFSKRLQRVSPDGTNEFVFWYCVEPRSTHDLKCQQDTSHRDNTMSCDLQDCGFQVSFCQCKTEQWDSTQKTENNVNSLPGKSCPGNHHTRVLLLEEGFTSKTTVTTKP